MEKEFVPYELALKLKALGFDEPCLAGYIRFRGGGSFELAFYKYRNVDFNTTSNIYVSAPLYQQSFRWFREKYSLYIVIKPIDDKKLELGYNLTKNGLIMGAYTTYEKAEIACLDKLIELTFKSE